MAILNFSKNDKKEIIKKEDAQKIRKLEKKIGYVFKDKTLILTALTHKSYANQYSVESNERLEFLGDSILAYVITHELYFKKTNKAEGDMTKMRAYIVCEDSLYNVAQKIEADKIIRVGTSQEKSVMTSKAILADMVEAIIAAIYCDSNLKQAKRFILKYLNKTIDYAITSKILEDYKTVFQESAQARGVKEIRYEIISEKGPDHDKEFIAEVYCDGSPLARGKGKTKKEAQTEAAKKALEKYMKIKE